MQRLAPALHAIEYKYIPLDKLISRAKAEAVKVWDKLQINRE